MMVKAVLLLLTLSVPCFAQTDKKPDVWEPLRYFIGTWEGTSKGQAGTGRSERQYTFIMNGNYVEVRNRSVYPPNERNAKGEMHEDLGIISYDRAKKRFVMRQFHVEGFVNQYVMNIVAPDNKMFGMETESIENIPPGWRAKETYKILNDDEFIEIFELAPPGKEFSTYTENHFKRKR